MATIEPRDGKKGRSYVVRYRDNNGDQRAKTFSRKVDATAYKAEVEHSVRVGTYIAPNAGKVTFKEHADTWVANHYHDARSRETISNKLKWYVHPKIGDRQIRTLKPSDISGLLVDAKGVRGNALRESTKGELLRVVSAILTGAVDDELVQKNVARSKSVARPKISRHKIQPWSPDTIRAVREALPERYKILVNLGIGLGPRQGEMFGLALDDLQDDHVEVNRQVKVYSNNRLTFDLPKYDKTRTVPLGANLRAEIDEYLERFPARHVTLPWDDPDNGRRYTAQLLLTSREGKALNKNYLNTVWRTAVANAGVDLEQTCKCCAQPIGRWQMMHILRHTYASALLDAGESIVAVAENLGHADPGFTLKTYTHLMHRHDERTRDAIDAFMKEAA